MTNLTKFQKAHMVSDALQSLDVGEGYYEPVKSIIYRYDNSILRTPSEKEVENILKRCRYNPKKDIVLSGVSIQSLITLGKR
jgi:hypothetical protein